VFHVYDWDWDDVSGAMPAVPPVILRIRHAVDLPEDPWYVTTCNKY